MKVRDSGMPEVNYWESLFQIDAILDGLKIDRAVQDAVELGCGYGTFTLPVAQRIRGILHSFDIEEGIIAATRNRLAGAGTRNVVLSHRDVITSGFGLPPGSVDAVILFNILHAEQPVELLRHSAELLRPAGRVLVIHWRSDIPTPRGPDLKIRPRPEQVREWALATSLLAADEPARIFEPWHFGLSLRHAGPKPG